jgi:hypothetical protein
MRDRPRTWRAVGVAVGAACAVVLLLTACSAPGAAQESGGGEPGSGIQRATAPGGARDGHFSDPYPLSGSTSAGGPPTMTFSGTFDEIMTCTGPLRPGCFVPSDLQVTFDPVLSTQIDAAHDTVHSTKAHHIYHRPDGSWDMVVTSEIQQAGRTWNVIFHARPGAGDLGSPPTHWVVDSVLSGPLTQPVAANYDGKLYDDGPGGLYLVYSGALSTDPQVFGVVAERLVTPSQPSGDPPVTLLAPDTADGGLNSENRFAIDQQGGFRLTETGNITKIGDKYVMVYAVGAFDRPDYKIGVAYSDTLLPSDGQGWRKVRQPDPAGVWGKPGQDEVRYLLQSQVAAWPNDVAGDVLAPGVGSLIENDGRWSLMFAGYPPGEETDGDGKYEASHRTPFFVPITLQVPAAPTVAAATDAQLATWIRPDL